MYNFNNLNEIFTQLEEGFCQGLGYNIEMLHSELFSALITEFICENKITENQFNEEAIKFKGLDLVYTDYKK